MLKKYDAMMTSGSGFEIASSRGMCYDVGTCASNNMASLIASCYAKLGARSLFAARTAARTLASKNSRTHAIVASPTVFSAR